jgi:hypothetical protein
MEGKTHSEKTTVSVATRFIASNYSCINDLETLHTSSSLSRTATSLQDEVLCKAGADAINRVATDELFCPPPAKGELEGVNEVSRSVETGHVLSLLLLIFFLPATLFSAGNHRISFDNDFPFETDRYYSHSFEYKYVSENAYTNWMKYLVPGGSKRPGYGVFMLSQEIYTPDHITNPEKQIGGHPYGGLFKADFLGIPSLSYGNLPRFISGFTVGITGPATLAYETQKTIHKMNSGVDNEPKGWGNQIGTAPYINLVGVLATNFIDSDYAGLSLISAGNIGSGKVGLETGLLFQTGNAKIVYTGTDEHIILPNEDSFQGSFFMNLRGEAKFYDAMLQGGITGDSPSALSADSVSKFIAKIDAGISIAYKSFGLFGEYSFQTPPFTDAEFHQYIEFGIVYNFK